MRRLAELLEALAAAPHPAARAVWLDAYFAAAPDPDRGWGAAWLLGALAPPRIGPARLRALAEPRAGAEMFRLSAAALGDVAETAALIWPGAGDMAPGAIIAGWDEPAALFDRLDAEPRRALARLYAGRRANGARFAEIRDALARLGGADPALVAGALAAEAPPFTLLFDWLNGGAAGDWPNVAPPALHRLAPGAAPPDNADVWPAPQGDPVRIIGGRAFDADGAALAGDFSGCADGWGFLGPDGYAPAPDGAPLADPQTSSAALLARGADGRWLLRPAAERRLICPVTFVEIGRGVGLTLGAMTAGEMVPLVKLPAPDGDASAVTAYARRATVEKFGPVRQVAAGLWAEVAYTGVRAAPRRKCRIALEDARLLRVIRENGPPTPTLEEVG